MRACLLLLLEPDAIAWTTQLLKSCVGSEACSYDREMHGAVMMTTAGLQERHPVTHLPVSQGLLMCAKQVPIQRGVLEQTSQTCRDN